MWSVVELVGPVSLHFDPVRFTFDLQLRRLELTLPVGWALNTNN